MLQVTIFNHPPPPFAIANPEILKKKILVFTNDKSCEFCSEFYTFIHSKEIVLFLAPHFIASKSHRIIPGEIFLFSFGWL